MNPTEDDGKRNIGREAISIAHKIKRVQSRNMEKENPVLSGIHGVVLQYLAEKNRQGQFVFQKDLEKTFGIRRSTATGVLQLMEQKGLITREPVPEDARLKRLVLTPKALAMEKRVDESVRELEDRMCCGLTKKQLDTFFEVTAVIRRNLDELQDEA